MSTSSASVIIKFPVDGHVYKYLQSKVGETMVVSNHHFLGGMILDMLSKRYYDLTPIVDEYLYPVEISLRYLEKQGFYIDSKTIRKFNNRVDSIFREELVSFVDINYRVNSIPKEKSLKAFLFDYNISEEDISLETLTKYIQRKINSKKDKKN